MHHLCTIFFERVPPQWPLLYLFSLRVYDGLGVQPVVSQQECLSLPYNLVGIVSNFSCRINHLWLSCHAQHTPLWSVLLSSSESLAWGWPIALCELSLWSSTPRRWTRNSSSWAQLSVILSGLCVFCAVSLVLDPQVWKCKCWHQQ